MSISNPTTIVPYKIGERPEEVFKVDNSPLDVESGETVEILIPSPEGFTVYFPYPGFFNAQVFEAEEKPSWAINPPDAEMWWGVRMTRISKPGTENPHDEISYCIYSKELNNFAVYNSPPKMKLEP